MVRRHLRKRATERSDGDFRLMAGSLADILGDVHRILGQRKRICSLWIGPRGDHGGIGEHVIDRALGASMRNHDFATAFAAVNRALVAIGLIVDMIENGITLSLDRDDFFVPRCTPTNGAILVGILG